MKKERETGALLAFSRTKKNHKPFRLVNRNGQSLIQNEKVRHKAILYLRDAFTTLVHLRWIFLVSLSCLTYVVTWISFALLWWLASSFNGIDDEPCVANVANFTSSFLLSVETQTTIGFGDLYISSGCYFGVFLLVLQSCFGVILNSFVIGVLFTKLARPRERGRTVLFSAKAVVWRNPETDRFYLQCRVGDVRKSHILEAHVRAMVFRFKEAAGAKSDKHEISIDSFDLDVGYGHGLDRLFLLFPAIVQHEIRPSSPFYDMSPADLARARIEIVFNLEGTMEATGMLTQKLVSYLPDDIVWGYKFAPMMFACKGETKVDFSQLNEVVFDTETPLCSPKEHDEKKEERHG